MQSYNFFSNTPPNTYIIITRKAQKSCQKLNFKKNSRFNDYHCKSLLIFV